MSRANVTSDNGQVQISIGLGDGERVLIWMSPDRALLLAASLAQHAAEALLQDAAEALLTQKTQRRLHIVED